MFGRERRSEKRLAIDIEARLVGAKPKRFPCSIKNVSPHGAKIRIPSEWILPAHFTLLGSRDPRDTLSCRLIWRNGDFAGARLSPRLE
jgi:hypothetical protein